MEINKEDIEAVEEAIEWLESEKLQKGDILHKEVKFDLNYIYQGLYGTCDIVIENRLKNTLKVYDYKHGVGESVEVENNSQLLYYALGAIIKFQRSLLNVFDWGDIYKEIEIGIIQPRRSHPEGPFRTWIVPPTVFNNFAKELREKAKATSLADAPLIAGKHCKWCKAEAICGAKYNQSVEIAKTDFRTLSHKTLPIVDKLTIEDISKILQYKDLISSWLKSIETYALQTLERGGKVPGFKLVKKRANRMWTDLDAVEDFLNNNYYVSNDFTETKMKSPTKLEKLVTKEEMKHLNNFIITPDNGNRIISEDDKRKEVLSSIKTDFEIINERNQ